ncbi:TPA: hypothetical protein ACSTJE_001481 [Serratia fonticola]
MNHKEKFKAALTAKEQEDARIANEHLLARQAEKQAFTEAVKNFSNATASLVRDIKGWVKDTGLNVNSSEVQMLTPVGGCFLQSIKINKGARVVSFEPQNITSQTSKGTINVVVENIFRNEQYALTFEGVAQGDNGGWEFVTLLSGRATSKVPFSEEVFFEFLTNVFAKN